MSQETKNPEDYTEPTKEIKLPTEPKELELIGFEADRLPQLNAFIDQMPHRMALTLQELMGPLRKVKVQE